MVNAPSLEMRLLAHGGHIEERIGNVAGFRRTTNLFIDNAELIALPAKPEHGLHEALAVDPEDPRDTKYEMRWVSYATAAPPAALEAP